MPWEITTKHTKNTKRTPAEWRSPISDLTFQDLPSPAAILSPRFPFVCFVFFVVKSD
jgi:hypothetical protein